MIILNYENKHRTKIIHACVAALKVGKVVAYPTDTSYGLGVDASNLKAIKKLYKIKGRNFNKPVHVVVPSVAYARKIVDWNISASQLARKFWPGALTLVLGLKAKGVGYRMLSARSGFIGLRMPKNQIALDLAKYLNSPITATSSNVSGKPDCYSADEIISQFQKQKFKPDIIINAGKLPERKPSTVVKIVDGKIETLRKGPVTVKDSH
jgi:L-threonylcarbamoyladenylate synthase